MNNFIVTRLSATSTSGKISTVHLEPGVNIVCGPSNSGKSMIVNCLDYLFGGKKEPFDPLVEEYDRVSMQLVNENGEILIVERAIGLEDGQAKPINEVTIDSEVDGIEGGIYKVKPSEKSKRESYMDILMQILGIPNTVKIISNQQGKTQRLSPRTFFHQLCIKEEDIFKGKSIIEKPGYNSITPCINALAYLIYEGGVREDDYEDPKIIKAKKTAVIAYISGKISSLESKREELQGEIEKVGTADVETLISEMMDEINAVDAEIAKALKESQELLKDIYETDDELTLEKQLKERYRALHTQYSSDVKRLEFIIEGESSKPDDELGRCPFCDSKIRAPRNRESYIEASKAELEKVRLQINDLRVLEDETDERISALSSKRAALQAKSSSVEELLTREFQPKGESLRRELENYRKIAQLKQEVETLDDIVSEFGLDIFEKNSEDESEEKYDAKEMFDTSVFNRLSSAVCQAIRECNYPEFRVAGLSQRTFDVVVNNKDKKHEGKGYRAFLNALYAFTLMKFIEDEGIHKPKMLIMDSPILSLKQDVTDPASDDMKDSLFSYIIRNCGSCQVLIAENDIPENVDYSDANIIRFGRGENTLRQGFLIRG